MSLDIEAQGNVRVVRWDDGENRVNLDDAKASCLATPSLSPDAPVLAASA